MLSGGASGAGVMPCADVAIVKAKPATAINLSMIFLHGLYSGAEAVSSRLGWISEVYWQWYMKPSSSFTKVPGVHVMPLRAA